MSSKFLLSHDDDTGSLLFVLKTDFKFTNKPVDPVVMSVVSFLVLSVNQARCVSHSVHSRSRTVCVFGTNYSSIFGMI